MTTLNNDNNTFDEPMTKEEVYNETEQLLDLVEKTTWYSILFALFGF